VRPRQDDHVLTLMRQINAAVSRHTKSGLPDRVTKHG
jgi:hypothetical protein